MTVHWLYWGLESDHEIDALSVNSVSETGLVFAGTGDPFGDSPESYWTGNATPSSNNGDRYASLKRIDQKKESLFDSYLWPNAGRFMLAFEYNAVGLAPPDTPKQIIFNGDRSASTSNQHCIGITHNSNDKLLATVRNEFGSSVSITFPGNSDTLPTITDWHNTNGRMGVFLDVDFPSGTLAAHLYTLGASPIKQSPVPRTFTGFRSLGPLSAGANVAQLSIGRLPSHTGGGVGSNYMHSSIRRLHAINFGAVKARVAVDGMGIPDNLAEVIDQIAADEMVLTQNQLALAGLIEDVQKTTKVSVRRYRIRVFRP